MYVYVYMHSVHVCAWRQLYKVNFSLSILEESFSSSRHTLYIVQCQYCTACTCTTCKCVAHYDLCMYAIHVIITLDLVLAVFMLHIYRKGSGRRGRGGASSRRGKGSSTDEQEATNSPATSGPSLKDQAAELLANQFLTVPSAGGGPSTSGQMQTQFVSKMSCFYLLLFLLSLSHSLFLPSSPPPSLSVSLIDTLSLIINIATRIIMQIVHKQVLCL